MATSEKCKYVLLDIEGTICPISFVKETLFPYALKALPEVVAKQWDDLEFQQYRDAFPQEHRSSPEAFQSHVEDLTKRDVKIAYLKNLQGYLWKDGYKTGAYSTPLFADVAPRLRNWVGDGVKLAIYSSGSVFAQKLLFAHVNKDMGAASKKRALDGEGNVAQPDPKRTRSTRSQTAKAKQGSDPSNNAERNGVQTKATSAETEDLTALIAGWFDTTNAGLKTEAESYTKIAQILKWQPERILFLSDNVKEVDASVQAGMQSLLVDRPGNAPVSEGDRARLDVIQAFDEISPMVVGTNGESEGVGEDLGEIKKTGAESSKGAASEDAQGA